MFVNGAGTSGGYTIAKSLRFRSSAIAYLSRTFSTPTNNTVWTYSIWCKRGSLTAYMELLSANGVAAALGFSNTDAFRLVGNAGSAVATSTAVFRDPSAHMHIVVTSNGTTVTVTANNVQVLSYTGTLTTLNAAGTHYIGRYGNGTVDLLDSYLSEINFIDGQALTPSSFGQTSSTTGQWIPKKYTGTYGTNGFYLPFNDGTNTTTLCQDRSGNGNNWTASGISLTAGATYDWMDDTPTNNFAVLNPLRRVSTSYGIATYSDGNLKTASSSAAGIAGTSAAQSSISAVTGKFYFEVTPDSNGALIGIATSTYTPNGTNEDGVGSGAVVYYGGTGNVFNNSVGSTAYGATYSTETIGVAVDITAQKVWFSKSGTWQASGDPATGSNGISFSLSGEIGAIVGDYVGIGVVNNIANFGQRPFTYTPPTGFNKLCTANLPAPTIKKPALHFDTGLYSGNGGTQSVTGFQFQPDFVWLKCRNTAGTDHRLWDSVRGATKSLSSDTTVAEITESGVTSFDTSGFTLGSQVGSNGSGNTYVDWLWKANGTAVTNNAGSITSQVSANTTAGFSIVTYTGTGANATVGHGLGVAPKMVIVKARNYGGATDWPVYSSSLLNTEYLVLNGTAAKASAATMWNSSATTSNVFSVGTAVATNNSTTNFVAYCFAEVPGFSKIGSYTGNGSADGPFVWCGFKPRWAMIKSAGSVASWAIFDGARTPSNASEAYLAANTSGAEGLVAGFGIDITSNGFKVRATDGTLNASGTTYIFIAIAEAPFNYATGR